MKALTLLWHHLIGKRTTIGGTIGVVTLFIWHGFLKFKGGEDIFMGWFLATVAESWLPFCFLGICLLAFHLCRLDLYLKLANIENEQTRKVNKQSVLIGSLLELVNNYSQVKSSIFAESSQSKAITYLNHVKKLPDMVDIRGEIDDFLSLFTKTQEGVAATVTTNYVCKVDADKDLKRVQELAQRLCKELDH